jgi:hypothetical protein
MCVLSPVLNRESNLKGVALAGNNNKAITHMEAQKNGKLVLPGSHLSKKKVLPGNPQQTSDRTCMQ